MTHRRPKYKHWGVLLTGHIRDTYMYMVEYCFDHPQRDAKISFSSTIEHPLCIHCSKYNR